MLFDEGMRERYYSFYCVVSLDLLLVFISQRQSTEPHALRLDAVGAALKHHERLRLVPQRDGGRTLIALRGMRTSAACGSKPGQTRLGRTSSALPPGSARIKQSGRLPGLWMDWTNKPTHITLRYMHDKEV